MANFIMKDVIAEDESKRGIVAIRLVYLVILAVSVLSAFVGGLPLLQAAPVRIFALAAVNVLLFWRTYHTRTRPALICFTIYLIAWVFVLSPCYGYTSGIQNNLVLLVPVSFYIPHMKMSRKFLAGGIFLGIRIFTIFLFGGGQTITPISEIGLCVLRIGHISAVFTALALLAFVFSKKENDAENKLILYNDRLKQQANTDQLTGLFNRRKAKECLKALIQSPEELMFSVAMGDIDYFKKVNDTYGHDAGDVVLKTVATIMENVCRSATLIARWGGEEFLLIFPDCNGDQAYVALERLRHTIEHEVIKVGETEIHVTMTFGLAECDYTLTDEQIIKEADEKLYQGKNRGRNRVVY